MSYLEKFWFDFGKHAQELEKEGIFVAAYLVDNNLETVEIDGENCLKTSLFNVSSQINAEWRQKSENRDTKGHQADKPDSAKMFLPFLPTGGIQHISWAILETYWSVVIRA